MKVAFADYDQHTDILIQAALEAADPAVAVQQHMQRDGRMLKVGHVNFDLDTGRVFVVSVGKAAVSMAKAAVTILGSDLAGGVVLTKKGVRAMPFAGYAVIKAFFHYRKSITKWLTEPLSPLWIH